jgi:transcriptional regulator with XRE-family HTH domain
MAKVSEQLRKAMERSGMTRYEIAKQAGIEQSSLSRFFSGERGLSQDAIDAICELLGLRLVSGTPRKRGKR